MVQYPEGRCPDCGERLYARTNGDDWCPNCVQRRTLAV